MRIVVGSDHRGVSMRAKIIKLVTRLGHEVTDLGAHANTSVDYPERGRVVARQVSDHEADRGILIDGTGLGMCIAANKFRRVRAAPCHDDLTAEMSRRHNDVNVLCLSGDMLGERLVDRLVEIWLRTEFEGGRHARRVKKIEELENQAHNGKPESSPGSAR